MLSRFRPLHKCLPSGGVRAYSRSSSQRLVDDVSVIGACCEVGQPRAGTRDAPDILRDLGILDYIRRSAYNVVDTGNIVEDNSLRGEVRGVKNPEAVGSFCRALSERISSQKDKLHLTLGGDHSMALGTVHGHATARPNLKVLWVDAHADINTDQTSPSGNLHGMPLGVLMQGLEGAFANMPGLDWFERKLRPEDIVYIGLRDVDDGEKEIMKRLGIKSFDNIEVEQRGVKAVVNDAMNLLKPSESQPLHLSFDIDALDPMYAPSTGTRVPFGLSREDGIYICQQVARTGALGGMDIVEVNPGLGSKLDVLKTARLAFDMVGASLGLSSAEIQDAQDEFEAVIPPLTARYGATHNMVRDLERDTTTAAPASSPAKEAEPQTEREARINHAKHSGRL
ncbi:arginase-1-like [Sycon ciliatum]|uniref:arginase-1-like n=1 Tax=Sycon ciliatum TaxID=27933 RepID=UPI0031F72166